MHDSLNDDPYHKPDNWSPELVDRIDAAYGAMQQTVHYWIRRNGSDMYYTGLLCRRCRDLIWLAIREKFGEDARPLIFELEDRQFELQTQKRTKRREFSEGKHPVPPFLTRFEHERLSAENLVVHEFATAYIQNKHRDKVPNRELHSPRIGPNVDKTETAKPQNPIFLGPVPGNPYLQQLAEALHQKEPLSRGDIINEARKITGENKGNSTYADNLASELRAYQSSGKIRKFQTAKPQK